MKTELFATALKIAKEYNVDISDKLWAYPQQGLGYYIQFLASGHKLDDFGGKQRELIERVLMDGKNPKSILDINLSLSEIEDRLDDIYPYNS